MKRVALALLFAVASPAGVALAYVRSASGTTDPLFLRWNTNVVSYQINNQTSDALPNVADGSDPLTAVARSFQAWEDLVPAAVELNFGGLTSAPGAGSAGNVVSFVDHAFAFNGALAVTLVSSSSGTIIDADMLFNPAAQWATKNPLSNQYDVQAVATHEAGHFIGLGHTGVHSATMYPYTKAQTQIERFLDLDDVAGAAESYPEERLAYEYGKITGAVTRGGAPVFGGHVVVVDLEGRPIVAALTTKDGAFAIHGVPPGSYQLYVEPVDGPFVQGNLTGYWTSPAFDAAFHGTLLDGFVDVVAGLTTSVGTIAANNVAPSFNPVVVGRQPAAGGSFTADGIVTTVKQGDVNSWFIIVGGSNCGSPTTFSIAGPGVTPVGSFSYGTFTGGTPYVKRRFDFQATAPASPRVIVVTKPGQTAYMTGPLEVLPNPARLHVHKDRLLGNSLYVTWYGGTPAYTLGRDTQRDFSAPIDLYFADDLNYGELGVLNDGIDYYYRIEE